MDDSPFSVALPGLFSRRTLNPRIGETTFCWAQMLAGHHIVRAVTICPKIESASARVNTSPLTSLFAHFHRFLEILQELLVVKVTHLDDLVPE